MTNQELYHKYSDWSEHRYGKRESDSMWRWINDHLNRFGEQERDAQLNHVMGRLAQGEPIQYITGKAYFFEMELEVNDHVLIPRPETEELVYHISQRLKSHSHAKRILDVGTGSGCIALGLKRQLPMTNVLACDVDQGILDVAQSNAAKYQLEIDFFTADFTRLVDFESVAPLDVLVSNPPYILQTERDVMSDSTRYEPDIALFSKEGPLWAYEALVEIALRKLKPDGFLAMEMSEFHTEKIIKMVESKGVSKYEIINDLQDKPRVIFCFPN